MQRNFSAKKFITTLSQNYQITITFTLLAIITGFNRIFWYSFKTRVVGLFFICFVTIISFCSEYLVNKTTKSFKTSSLKALVALSNTLFAAIMLLIIYFYIF